MNIHGSGMIVTRYEGTPAEIREYERLRELGEPHPVRGESARDSDLAPELARFLDRVSHRSLVSEWLSWALTFEIDVSGIAGHPISARVGRGSAGRELDYVRLYTEGCSMTIAALQRSGRLTFLLGKEAANGHHHVRARDVRDPHKVFVELHSQDALEEAKVVFRQAVAARYGR